jgi:hypothetical protein
MTRTPFFLSVFEDAPYRPAPVSTGLEIVAEANITASVPTPAQLQRAPGRIVLMENPFTRNLQVWGPWLNHLCEAGPVLVVCPLYICSYAT